MLPREAENQSPLNQYHKSEIMQHKVEVLCHQVVDEIEIFLRIVSEWPSGVFQLKKRKPIRI